MKAVGIIVEYNPFHNGHYYHIQASKERTGADVVVAVMSGNFLQRGEPALVSKWTRTKMALEGGVDLVVELPYVFATQKADIFAYGAVALLDALHVDSICFGSEHGKIESFIHTLHVMNEKKADFNHYIKTFVKEGKSYPRAAAEAFHALNSTEQTVDLSLPNNILGFYYMQAIQQLNSSIHPYTIQRMSANYHDTSFNHQSIASATSIRKAIFQNLDSFLEIKHVVPKETYVHLTSYKKKNNLFHHWEAYFPFFKYQLLSMSKEQLEQIYEIEEGLENRMKKQIPSALSFQDFMKTLKTKRYTWTRLQRTCIHILTNTTKEEMKRNQEKPTYIRLLGASLKGQQYLNKMKKTISLPIIAKKSSFSNEQLHLDRKAALVYATCLQEPERTKQMKEEYIHPPIRYDQERKIFL